jgi:hypothetical protein
MSAAEDYVIHREIAWAGMGVALAAEDDNSIGYAATDASPAFSFDGRTAAISLLWRIWR